MQVMFTAGWFPFKYGWFVCLACREVVSWYLNRTVQEVPSDSTVRVHDKTGSVTDKRSRTELFPGGSVKY